MKVGTILDTTSNVKTKFFALSVLEDTITTRWKLLPPETRQAVRSFIVSKMIEVCLPCGFVP